MEWSYRTMDGKSHVPPEIVRTDEIRSYRLNGNLTLAFPLEPDTLSIQVTKNGTRYAGATLENLASFASQVDEVLDVFIRATWNGTNEEGVYLYSGSASYSFQLHFDGMTLFTLDRTEVQTGEFLTVRGDHVPDPSLLSCTVDPPLGQKTDIVPVFYADAAGSVVAYLPLPRSAEARTYTLHVSYGTFRQALTFTLTENDRTQSGSASYSTVNAERLREALAGTHALLDLPDPHRYGADPLSHGQAFASPQDLPGVNVTERYNSRSRLSDGSTLNSDWTFLSVAEGTAVTALNTGRVLATGHDEFLGNYVVLEHGYGLRCWYFNLNNLHVNTGQCVLAGETVGTAGLSLSPRRSGFGVLYTVRETPISPDALAAIPLPLITSE
jgi:hypothetical protein